MQKKTYLLLVLVLSLSSFLLSQKMIKVKDIKEKFKDVKDEVVIVEGFITQYIEGSAQTTARYYLKGDWGGIITVRTAKESPEVGKRYKIRGIVDLDEFNEPFITEIEKIVIDTENTVEANNNESNASISNSSNFEKPNINTSSQKNNTLIFVLIGASFIVLIVLVLIILSLKKGKETPAYVTPIPTENNTNPLPEPEKVIEGSTIKMQAPPKGTLKILPGKLSVVSGDDTVKEIRFYKIPGENEVALTFGRGSGKPYSHIQLKPMTVSSKQAKIIYNNNKHSLINFSKTNPTLLNGEVIKADHPVDLKSGDNISMGEVVFKFSID